jgi:hypothetical protein
VVVYRQQHDNLCISLMLPGRLLGLLLPETEAFQLSNAELHCAQKQCYGFSLVLGACSAHTTSSSAELAQAAWHTSKVR